MRQENWNIFLAASLCVILFGLMFNVNAAANTSNVVENQPTLSIGNGGIEDLFICRTNRPNNLDMPDQADIDFQPILPLIIVYRKHLCRVVSQEELL